LNGTHPINRPLKKWKKVIGAEIQVILCYTDFKKPDLFHRYTDASDHQLGAIIMQDRKPIAFYSRKLNKAHKCSSKAVNFQWKKTRVVISYFNLQGIQEYPIRLPHGLGRILRWLLLLEENGISLSTSQAQERKMWLRMFYLIMTLIAWIFKKNKHEDFSQDLKTATPVISNQVSQCILPWSSKNKQKLRKGYRIKRKGLIPISLLNKKYWRVWYALLKN
jgi:hypothetical protein